MHGPVEERHFFDRSLPRTAAAGAWLTLLIASSPCMARLGGDVAGIEQEARALQGELRTTALLPYDLYEIATPVQRVREYVTRGGVVFALAWSGPVPPDLSQLLGDHYGNYAATLAALDHPGLRRSLRVALPDLIVESSGHLRAYQGRAYLPALVPEGVALADIR
jgi:hypothetical protein